MIRYDHHLIIWSYDCYFSQFLTNSHHFLFLATSWSFLRLLLCHFVVFLVNVISLILCSCYFVLVLLILIIVSFLAYEYGVYKAGSIFNDPMLGGHAIKIMGWGTENGLEPGRHGQLNRDKKIACWGGPRYPGWFGAKPGWFAAQKNSKLSKHAWGPAKRLPRIVLGCKPTKCCPKSTRIARASSAGNFPCPCLAVPVCLAPMMVSLKLERLWSGLSV